MTDIVERLRTSDIYDPAEADKICREAADEIEKLRKTIRDALKLADLDAIKSFRKTLLLGLGEKL